MHFRDLDTDPSPKTMQEEARETNLSLGGAHKRPGGSSGLSFGFIIVRKFEKPLPESGGRDLSFRISTVAMCVLAVAAR